MTQVLRSFDAIVDEVNTKNQTIVAKINTNRLDYYRTVIDPLGGKFDDYVQSPVVLWCHGKDQKNRGELPIGRNLWIRIEDSDYPKIIAKTKFRDDDFSRALYESYRDGDIRGWSVSIIPDEFSKPTQGEIRSRPELDVCEMIFRSWALSEYSAVPCPGNPDCISVDEARSMERLVSRGITLPDELYQQFTKVLSEARPPDPRVIPEITSDPIPDTPPVTEVETGNDPVLDSQPEEIHEAPESPPVVEADVVNDPGPEPVPVIELPPLVGRTFSQIFHTLRQEEIEYQDFQCRKIEEHINWLLGKV